MNNRVAIITGGASGIGKASAEALASAGHRVVISDVNASQGQRVADALGGYFVAADLAQRAQCRRLVDETLNLLDRVDVLVNSAGFQHISPIDEFPEEAWDELLAVMLTAPFLLTKYAWPSMKAGGWGRIVNIGSIHSVVASPFKVGYVAAKHGLLGLTRTAAREGGEFGITVNAILPAYVRTPLVESQIRDQARTRNLAEDEVVEKVMLGGSPPVASSGGVVGGPQGAGLLVKQVGFVAGLRARRAPLLPCAGVVRSSVRGYTAPQQPFPTQRVPDAEASGGFSAETRAAQLKLAVTVHGRERWT